MWFWAVWLDPFRPKSCFLYHDSLCSPVLFSAAVSEEIGRVFKKLFECRYFNVDVMRDVVCAWCFHVNNSALGFYPLDHALAPAAVQETKLVYSSQFAIAYTHIHTLIKCKEVYIHWCNQANVKGVVSYMQPGAEMCGTLKVRWILKNLMLHSSTWWTKIVANKI